VTVPLGRTEGAQAFTVPPNNQLVLEYVTATVDVTRGEAVRARLATVVNGITAVHRLPLVPTSTPFVLGMDQYEAGQNVRLYADAGTTVAVTLLKAAQHGEARGTFTLTGYTTDIYPVVGPVIRPPLPLTPLPQGAR
jgi:hypothetical protein